MLYLIKSTSRYIHNIIEIGCVFNHIRTQSRLDGSRGTAPLCYGGYLVLGHLRGWLHWPGMTSAALTVYMNNTDYLHHSFVSRWDIWGSKWTVHPQSCYEKTARNNPSDLEFGIYSQCPFGLAFLNWMQIRDDDTQGCEHFILKDEEIDSIKNLTSPHNPLVNPPGLAT